MPLAPRTPSDAGGKRSSVKSAEGKANQRARTKEAAKASGEKQLTLSGSSGTAKRMADYPSLDWEEVASDVVHITDLSAKVTQSQLGAHGYYTMLMAIPQAYAHAALDAAFASTDAMLYIRVYKVPIEAFLEKMQRELDEATGATEEGGEDGVQIASD